MIALWRRCLAGLPLCLALLTWSGLAQAAADPEARDPAASIRRIALPLDRLNLNGGLAEAAATIHLPPTVVVVGARLVVRYANALAVSPEGSGLQIGANGRPLAEVPLVAAQGAVNAEIDLPAGILTTGPNHLTLSTRQRHRLECSRAGFEELWTRIEPTGSYLQLRLEPRPSALKLSNLDAILGSSLYDGEPVTILTRRAAADPEVATWGGLLAEGLALRRPERAVYVRHAQLALTAPATAAKPAAAPPAIARWAELAGQNYVVVGTFAELGKILPDEPVRGGAGGMIALRLLPADPDHVAVIISGETDAAVARAAAQFRALETDWPRAAAVAVGYAPPPAAQPADRYRTGVVETLASLGAVARDLPISFAETVDVTLQLPDDYYAGDGQRVELGLNYAYGAGLASNSALIIRVNGAPWNMLRLDREAGDVVDDARIELPMGLFRPGHNVIGFEPVLHPAAPGACDALGDQAMFSLFGDSRIRVPQFARLAHQPDLALFAATGFPYGSAAGDPDVELVIADPTPAVVASAWTLRAKLAQRRGRPLFGLRTSVTEPTTTGHLLVVGAIDRLPTRLTNAAPLPLEPPPPTVTAAGSEGVPADQDRAPVGQAREQWAKRLGTAADDDHLIGSLTRWLIRFARAVPAIDDGHVSYADLETIGARKDAGTIVAYRSPDADDRTVTIVTAQDSEALERAVDTLVSARIWPQLQGDISRWSPTSGQVMSHSLTAPYAIHRIDTSLGHLFLVWRTFMAKHQGYWLVLVFGTLLGLTAVTALVLRRMRG